MKIKKENLLFLLPLILGSAVLFFGLGDVFKNLVSDERSFLLDADLLKDLPYYPYLIYPNNGGTTHTLLPYLMLIPLKTLGYTVFSVRFIPALFGLLGIVAYFFLLKNLLTNHKLAVFGSIILAFTHWYIAISRVAIELSEFIFFSIFNLLLLTLFIKNKNQDLKKSLIYMFLVGLSFGLVQHTYQAARFYILFYALYLPIFWFFNKTKIKTIFFQGLSFSMGFLLIISPLLYVFSQHPRDFESRRGELIFSQNLNTQDLIWSLKQSTLRTLGMFHIRGSDVSCYNIPGKPMLDITSGLLFIIGMAASFKTLRKEFNLILWLFFLISLLPSILSYWPAAPHGLRSAGLIIPTIAFITLGLDKISSFSKKYGLFIMIVILLLIAFLNLKSYFVDLYGLQNDCYKFGIDSFEKYKADFLESSDGVKFIR